ncbi:MAG: tetratricopeptide repeat protein [Cyanobacteria bacterium CRU_2_1]|nr:tetratricopeptide repeat protein [Cyanobacteria bacterium CRU_2_1]
MKKNPWLDVLENISLVGSGVGAVASVLSSQLSYAVAPLSLALVLGVMNRNRFEQDSEQNREASLAELDQRLSEKIDMLTQHMMTLPTPEVVNRLKKGVLLKNRELAENLYSELATVQQEIQKRLEPIEEFGLGSVRQELRQLQERYVQLSEGLTRLDTNLAQFSDSSRVDGLESQINRLRIEIAATQGNLDNLANQTKPNLVSLEEQLARLDRQVSKLSPQSEINSLKQEIAEVVKGFADLVPRRDVTALSTEIHDLHQQQEALRDSVSNEVHDLHQQQEGLRGVLSGEVHDLHQQQEALRDSVMALDAVTDGLRHILMELADSANLPHPGSPETASGEYPELQELASQYLNYLRSQLAAIQGVTDTLSHQQKHLQDQISQLPQTLDVVALQRQLTDLSRQIPDTETTLESFKSRMQDLVQQELQTINQQLQTFSASPDYELIFDLDTPPPDASETESLAGSKTVLEEALESTQRRLILIWPWSNQCSLDETLMQKLEMFLNRKRRLDLGWCHIADRNEERLLSKLRRGWMTELKRQNELQETLHKLLHLKRAYPDYFQFKILGTNENFLVSDASFAVLGISDALRTSTAFAELQLKLRTKDPDVIQRLVKRFDDPTLTPDDLVAFWNRGVTRYDLGDKAGAIADYSHILSINPDDDITYNYRGLAYYDLGDIEAAVADFTRSIHLDPHQAAAYCNRGFVRSEQGDQGGAINDYSMAIQAQPDCAIAYFYRGMTWQKLESHQAAVADYSEAIYLAPDSAVARYYRGLAWQKLDNYSEAITDLEAAANLFDSRGSKTNAQKALKNLAKLRQMLTSNLPKAESRNYHTPPVAYGVMANRTNGTATLGSETIANRSQSSEMSANGQSLLASQPSDTFEHSATNFLRMFTQPHLTKIPPFPFLLTHSRLITIPSIAQSMAQQPT